MLTGNGKKPVMYLIETLYDMGSHHCLYRPGAPLCEGTTQSFLGRHTWSPDDPAVGDVWFHNQHDSATRRIVFREQTPTSAPISRDTSQTHLNLEDRSR